jgi:hypothetical protein
MKSAYMIHGRLRLEQLGILIEDVPVNVIDMDLREFQKGVMYLLVTGISSTSASCIASTTASS